MVATYRHLSPFACPSIRGSFADGEVGLDTQSRYYDRSVSPNLVVYKKCSFYFIIIKNNTAAFDILGKCKFEKYYKGMLFETIAFHTTNETAF